MRRPSLRRVRSLAVPTNRVVSVAVMALAATIQAIGLGSGVSVSKTKVLNQAFSIPYAICPDNPNNPITTQVTTGSLVWDVFDACKMFILAQ